MQKKYGFRFITAITLVAILSSILCFASIPASAMTIDLTSPSSAVAGTVASFNVVLNVTALDKLPVSNVQMDIFNVNNAAYRDTFTNLPLNTTSPAVVYHSTTDSTHNLSVLAIAATGWGNNQGGTATARWGDDGTGSGNHTFGTGYGWGYSVGGNYIGVTSISYPVNWTVPAGFPAGTYKAQIRVDSGSTSGTPYTYVKDGTTFNVTSSAAAPTITSFNPASGTQGTSVVITGTNFTNDATVYFIGVAAQSRTVDSSTQITAIVGSGTAGASGVITVTTPNGTVNSSATFTYASALIPTITSFTPTSGTQGTQVIIYGTNLSNVTAVSFGSYPAQSFQYVSTYIIAYVGSGINGYVYVTVTNAYGIGTSTSTFYYTGSSGTVPAISSISPSTGGYGTTVYIYGTNLSYVTGVSFGGTPALSYTVYSTYIYAVVGNGSSGYVTVTSAYGSAQSTTYFYYTGSTGGGTAPIISSLSVYSGGYGTTVQIYGSNLSYVTGVTFGGTAALSFNIVSASQVNAVVGSGTSGYVMVTSSYGSAQSPSYFTYTGSTTIPTISAVTPATGSTGTQVIITGTNFTNTNAVSFGGVPAQSFNINSDTQITAIVASGASGTVNVTNAYGTGTWSGFTFGSTSAATSLAGKVDAAGKFNTNVTASYSDNKASVTINSGTTGKLGGAALTQITIAQTDATAVPTQPAYSSYVSLTYDFGPSGATFDKPVSVSIIYDQSMVPPGVDESSLFMAWWDATGNKWTNLPSVVDKVNKKITAQADHFTNFAIIGTTQKARFGVSDLQVSPKQVQAGKEVTITVILGNGGAVAGSYDVKLIINGKEVSTKRVENMPGGETQKLTFTNTQSTPGPYKVEVEYLNDTFTVTPAPTTPPVTTPAVTTPATTAPIVTTPATTTVKPTVTTTAVTPTPSKAAESGGFAWWLIVVVVVIFLIIVWIVYRVIMYQKKSGK